MERVLDPSLRTQLARGAQLLGGDYDMGELVLKYGAIYDRLIAARAAGQEFQAA
jgi:hypothetical protein